MKLRLFIAAILIGWPSWAPADQKTLEKRVLGVWKSTSLKSSHENFPLLFQSLSFYPGGRVALIEVNRPIHWRQGSKPGSGFASGYASIYRIDDDHPDQVYIVNRWFDVAFEIVGTEKKYELMTLKTGDDEEWWEYKYVRLIGDTETKPGEQEADQPATAVDSNSKDNGKTKPESEGRSQ